MERKRHNHDRDGMEERRGGEAKDIGGAMAGRLHQDYCPVFFRGGHRSPDIWELCRRDGFAKTEQAPQVRSPLLCLC